MEEIARLDGYDRIPSVLPTAPAGTGLTTAQRARRLVAQGLAHAGLTEVESYPFVSDSFDKQGLSANDPRRRAVKLRNPLADDAPLLRTSVLDTLLDPAARNWARGIPSVAIFEIAKVVHPEGVVPTGLISAEHRPSDAQLAALEAGTPSQPWHVGAVLAGNARPAGILDSQRTFDWADAVEVACSICDQLGVRVEVTRAWLAEPSRGLDFPRLPRIPLRSLLGTRDGLLEFLPVWVRIVSNLPSLVSSHRRHVRLLGCLHEPAPSSLTSMH